MNDSSAPTLRQQIDLRMHHSCELEMIGVAITSLEKGWIDFNTRLCEILDYPRERLMKKSWADITHRDDLEADIYETNRVLAGKTDEYLLEKRFVRGDGEVVEVEFFNRGIRNQHGDVDYFVAVIKDIHRRKQVEQALRVAEVELKTILDNLPAYIFFKDTQNNIRRVNKRVADSLGVRPEAMVGKPFKLFYPSMAEQYYQGDLEMIRSGKPKLGIVEPLETEAGMRWLETNRVPIVDHVGDINGILVMAADITERKQRVEDELKRYRNRLEKIVKDRTDELRATHQLLQCSQESLAKAQQLVHVGNWYWNIRTDEFAWSDEIYRIFGVARQQFAVTYNAYLKRIHPDDRKKVINAINGSIRLKQPYIVNYRIIRPDGTTRFVRQNGEVSVSEQGDPMHLIGTLQDITEIEATNRELRLSVSVFLNLSEGLIVTDLCGRIERVNPAFTSITGYDGDSVLHRNCALLNSPQHAQAYNAELWTKTRKDGHWQGEVWHRHKNGQAYPAWLSVSCVSDAQGEAMGFVCLFNDITEWKTREQQIWREANFDSLTSLPNRKLMLDRLNVALKQARRHNNHLALLFIDLDRFKMVNDSLGHDAGDRLLVLAAERLQACVRESDIIGRLGGDEFTILLSEINAPDDVIHVARKVLATLAQPFDVQRGQEAFVSASIGITLAPDDGADVNALIKNADTAMYKSKQEGRNRYKFFTQEMNRHALWQAHIEQDMRRSLENQAEYFEPRYQPIVDLETGGIRDVEVLLRWSHPDHCSLSPQEFIPIAEDSGLIGRLDHWVLHVAALQLEEWHASAHPRLRLSVNVSSYEFRDLHYEQQLATLLAETDLTPDRLVLEITESLLMSHTDDVVKRLNRLTQQGITLSVDDFGTGYSSLSYLTRFPVQIIKIDQSFIRDVCVDANDASVVRAIIAMAHNLGIKTVAEGIETEAQLSFLREAGCELGQGYFFCKPLTAEEFKAYLDGHLAA